MAEQVSSTNEAPARRASIWDALEKVIIPIALGMLAYFGKKASDQLSAAQVSVAAQQVQVAKLQLASQTAEANLNLQLKYVELFYHDLQDPDLQKRQSSILLLAAMQPSVAQMVARAVNVDPNSSPQFRQQVGATLLSSQRFGPLVNYKITVYFEPAVTADATKLRDNLVHLGFPGTIELRQRGPQFLDDATKFGYHIRYDDVFEDDAADYLMNLLPDVLPGRQFTSVRVVGARAKSDGILTVFLFNKR